jgi:hypothetical protein
MDVTINKIIDDELGNSKLYKMYDHILDTLAKCAVNPRPIGRGYKALKNNVFY